MSFAGSSPSTPGRQFAATRPTGRSGRRGAARVPNAKPDTFAGEVYCAPSITSGPRASRIPATRAPGSHEHTTQGDEDGHRNGEVVQPDKGLRIHSTSGRRQGCV